MNSQHTRYVVAGVCCSTEEGVLRKGLDASLGSENYEFNQLTMELTVAPGIQGARVLRGVRRAGFQARPIAGAREAASFLERHREGIATLTASAMTVAGLLLDEGGVPLPARTLLLGAILLGGWRILLKALAALRVRALDMNVLMTIAVAGALVIDRWGEAAAVIVLFSVALMLESYSTARTRKAVRSLLALSPRRCSVVREGREQTLAAEEVAEGETMVIRPGERIPLDGLVESGSSSVDQGVITGESEPVLRSPGLQVFAGSLNGRGVLTVRVTRRYEDTTLAHIVSLIEESQKQRAPVQQMVDRFARVYTPAVLVVAALVAILPPLLLQESGGVWFYRSLVLLVIACPCALVISTPVTLVSALTAAARQGVLVKGGKHLETLSRTSVVAFDKTGTLTEGQPRVTDVIALNGLSRAQILRIAAAVEHRSEHPLADAVVAEAVRSGVEFLDLAVEGFEALPGFGVRALVEGTEYTLGNDRLSGARGHHTREVEGHRERLAREGKTAVVLGRGAVPLAVIGLRDSARDRSRDALAALRAGGILHLVMLSGDTQEAAGRVARELGIEHASAGLLPEQKVEALRDLHRRYGPVAMVGDGINDAPALAAASTGIAMGVAGSDAALETADVVLMSDEIQKLPGLFSLSRQAMRIIRQNIALALGIKLVFVLLSVAGISTLWMAILADDGAALAVIANGLRLLRFRGDR
jgi:Cd2+/Zn2+-exporting ATPase